MKPFSALLAVTFTLLSFSPAAASWSTATVVSPVDGVITAANANNVSMLNSYFKPNAVVVDEFAPYVWVGRDAAIRWWHDLGKLNAKTHVTNVHLVIQKFTQVNVANNRAYVVARLLITWGDHGHPWREIGLWALTVQRRGTDWKIASASWATESIVSIP
jgi:hypothetical protein